MKETLVTVCVPAYNHERYIIECLDSIKCQTYKDYQWIVVDDCSSDRTPEILKENQNKYGYELILHKKNIGISATLTEIIRDKSFGKYFALCASDDSWLPNKLQVQVDYMESHPDDSLCYGYFYLMDVESKILGPCQINKYRGGYIFNDLLKLNFDIPPNSMIRKNVIEKMGYYQSGVIAEDFYMYTRISHEYSIGLIPDYISYYRYAPLHGKRDPLTLMLSIEDTINFYKNEDIYKEAYSLHCLRCFDVLSSYRKYKILSLKYLFKVQMRYVRMDSLVKGVYHFIRWWV